MGVLDMLRLSLLLILPLLLLASILWFLKFVWALIFDPQHGWALAKAQDQLANAVLNGHEDEKISSRAYRHSLNNEDREAWVVVLRSVLDRIEKDHCKKSYENDFKYRG
jgi:ABC-type multidrug transport system fused ATPase/permease subunit